MHLARCIHGAETGNARAVNAANVFRIIDQNDAASTAAVIPKRMVDQGLLAGSDRIHTESEADQDILENGPRRLAVIHHQEAFRARRVRICLLYTSDAADEL